MSKPDYAPSKHIIKLSLITLIVFLITLGIGLRFSGLHSPMQQDEVRHNAILLGAESIPDLKERMEAHTQPLLSYMQKMYLWFEVIPPSNEVSLKTPSAIYSCLVLFIAIGFFFKRKDFLLAALIVFTLFSARQELLAANNARHYAYIAFCSMLFILSFYSLLFDKKQKTVYYNLAFYLTGFLLLNAHLFAWPLVGVCFTYPVLSQYFWGSKKQAITHGFISSAVFAISIFINWFVIDRLWNEGHHFSHDADTQINWGLFFDRYDSFLTQFSFPIAGISASIYLSLILLLSVFFIYRNHEQKKERLFFFASLAIGLFLTLFMAMSKSTKGISLRYMIAYSPVFAVASSLLLSDILKAVTQYYHTYLTKKAGSYANSISISTSLIVFVFVIIIIIDAIESAPYLLERRGSASAFINRDFITEKERNRDTKLRLNSGIKSISLKIRKEQATAIAFELSDHGHIAQWEMYNKYLYRRGRGKFPESKVEYYYYGEKGRQLYLDTTDRKSSPNYIFRNRKYDKYLKADLDFIKQDQKYDYLLVYNYYKNPYLDKSFDDLSNYSVEKDIQGISFKKHDGKITKQDIVDIFKYLDIPRYQ